MISVSSYINSKDEVAQKRISKVDYYCNSTSVRKYKSKKNNVQQNTTFTNLKEVDINCDHFLGNSVLFRRSMLATSLTRLALLTPCFIMLAPNLPVLIAAFLFLLLSTSAY